MVGFGFVFLIICSVLSPISSLESWEAWAIDPAEAGSLLGGMGAHGEDMMSSDLYERLGLPPQATDGEIAERVEALAPIYTPDSHLPMARQMGMHYMVASAVLGNGATRAQYDAEGIEIVEVTETALVWGAIARAEEADLNLGWMGLSTNDLSLSQAAIVFWVLKELEPHQVNEVSVRELLRFPIPGASTGGACFDLLEGSF